MLVIVCGSSGCGKNTIINEVLNKNKDYGFMPTLTTREMREGECQGQPYIFVTKDEFMNRVNAGEMVEYVEVHKGVLYGVSRKIYEEYAKKYRVLVKDVDVDGVQNLRNAGIDIVSIFVEVSDKQNLIDRIVKRGQSLEDAQKRVSRFDYEYAYKNKCDYIVKNNTEYDLENVIKQVEDIIKAELQKRGHIE